MDIENNQPRSGIDGPQTAETPVAEHLEAIRQGLQLARQAEAEAEALVRVLEEWEAAMPDPTPESPSGRRACRSTHRLRALWRRLVRPLHR